MTRFTKLKLIALSGAAVAALAPPQALAQTQTSETAIDEIVVTAQRREQKLQDVGIAISAFGGEALRDKGVQSGRDLANLTPGVFISGSSAGQNAQYTIRGVVQNDFNDAIEAPVAVYVDETYIPSLSGQVFGLFDLERVEILKGPQGTLFGRNATGGLVHFVPRKPTKELDGFVDLTYARFDQIRAEMGAGGPLGGKISGRVSMLYDRHGNLWNNIYPAGAFPAPAQQNSSGVQTASANPPAAGTGPGLTPPRGAYGEDLGREETLAGRVQLQFDATDELTIRLTGSAARVNFGVGPYNAYPSAFAANGIDTIRLPRNARMRGGLIPGASPEFVTPLGKDRELSVDWARDDGFYSRAYDTALHINYEGESFNFVSISNFKQFKKYIGVDVEAGPINFVNFGSRINTKSISQEFRFNGETENMRWVAGAYYLNIKADLVNGFMAPANSTFDQIAGLGGPGIDLLNVAELDTKSYSAFGQIEYDVAEKVTLIAGGRIIREKQSLDWTQFGFANSDDFQLDNNAAPLFPIPVQILNGAPTVGFENNRSKTLWAGKVQVEFRPMDDLLLYAGVNRGVKGGAYNITLPDGSPLLQSNRIPYKPETLVSYEAGFKSTLADGKVTFNGSAYYYDYNNYQAFTFVNVTGVVTNEDARVYGAELDLQARPVEGLVMGGSVSILDPKVKGLQVAPGVVRDVEPSFAPKFQFSGNLAYTFPADVGGGAVTLGGDVAYSAKFWHNLRNFPSHRLPGYWLVNTRLNWEREDGALRLSLFVNNLFDKRYVNIGYDLTGLCGCSEESYGDPRWWGITAGYKF